MTSSEQADVSMSLGRGFADRHLALLAALSVVVVATLRVYFVSGFDLPTALSVLAVVDRTQLLSASLLAALVVVLPLLFIQPAVRRWMFEGNGRGAPFSAQMRTALLWIPLSLVVAFTLTLPLLIGWGLGVGFYVVARFIAVKKAIRLRKKPPARNAPLLGRSTSNWLLATFTGFLLLTVLTQPWLAREAVGMRSGETVIASVVGTQGDMTLLMSLEPHGARWVPTHEVVSRQLCRDAGEWFQLTLGSLRPEGGIPCDDILSSLRRA